MISIQGRQSLVDALRIERDDIQNRMDELQTDLWDVESSILVNVTLLREAQDKAGRAALLQSNIP